MENNLNEKIKEKINEKIEEFAILKKMAKLKFDLINAIEDILNRNNEGVDIIIDDDVYSLATPAQLETALELSKAVKEAKEVSIWRGGVDLLIFRVEFDYSPGDYCAATIDENGVIIR